MKSLFTNKHLDQTVEVAIKRIYEKQEIAIDIGRREIIDLLILCTKNVPFTFHNEMYQQRDGVVMGYSLGSALTGTIMVELGTWIVLNLENRLCFWKRYVDDTLALVK